MCIMNYVFIFQYDRPLTDKEKKSVQLKNQTRRQASYIPRVVTELELFVNLITKLGKKCKVIIIPLFFYFVFIFYDFIIIIIYVFLNCV